MSTLTNGRVRKSLADQLDRLDHTLDNLAEGLQEAVETAVQEAVRRVLNEVLTNPVLLQKVQGNVQPEPTPKASLVSRLVKKAGTSVCQVWSWCIGKVKAACSWCSDKIEQTENAIVEQVVAKVNAGRTFVRQLCGCIKGLWTVMQTIRVCWWPLLTAISVGVACGAVIYFAGPWIGAVAGGVSGFVAAAAVQMGMWLRRLLVLQDAVEQA